MNLDKKLWQAWTINCAIGELLGIAAADAMAFFVNHTIHEPQHFGMKVVVLVLMLVAGAIEGTCLSCFQWRILVRKFPTLPLREWLSATVLIAVLGWFLGMMPSLFLIPEDISQQQAQGMPNFDNPIVFAFLSISAGLFLGTLFGLFQWFVLRKYALRASRWIIANALGWGAGLGWIYCFASIPTPETTLQFNVFMGVCGGVLAGLTVGAITGVFFVSLGSIHHKEH